MSGASDSVALLRCGTEKIEPMHILSIRQIIPTIPQIGQLWDETYKALLATGQDEVSPYLSIGYDENFTAKDMAMEIIYPVAQSCPDTIDLAGGRKMPTRELAGIPLAACSVHKGDYAGLGEAYTSLGRWIAANGYNIVGAPREVYLHGGGGPEAVTEIQFPVEKV